MLYRILTETINNDRQLRNLAHRHIGRAYTILHGVGVWEGTEEPCTIVEFSPDAEQLGDGFCFEDVQGFAQAIRLFNKQDVVLVQVIETRTEFIGADNAK